jgi:hypothetical protein
MASVASLQENIFEGESGFQIAIFLTVLTLLVVGSTLFLFIAVIFFKAERDVEVVAVRAFSKRKPLNVTVKTALAVTKFRALLRKGDVNGQHEKGNAGLSPSHSRSDIEMSNSLKLTRPETIDPTFDDINLSSGAEERLSVHVNEQSMNPLAAAKQEQRFRSQSRAIGAAFDDENGEERGEAKSNSKVEQQEGGEKEGAPPIVTSSDVQWTQQIDEATGKTYYYSGTGETTWDPVRDTKNTAKDVRERPRGFGDLTTAL